MGVGEFFILFAIIIGTYLIVTKILSLIEWKMKYDVSVKEAMDKLEAEIKKDDLQ